MKKECKFTVFLYIVFLLLTSVFSADNPIGKEYLYQRSCTNGV